MIVLRQDQDERRRFADRLAAKARALTEARLSARRPAIQRDPGRWRRAGWLWPLFAKD